MPSFNTLRRAIPAAILSITFAAAADTCWYPDGKTVSSDIPCNANATASACCSSQSYCFEGGLCVTGGLLTRGSCTDQTWDSPECADFCKTVDVDGEIGISPCTAGVSTNTFVCGLDNNLCNQAQNTFTLSSDTQLILRPAQIEYLVKNALASNIPSSTASAGASSGSSSGAIIGTAVGVAVPLLIVLGIVSYLLVRERRRAGRRQNMYKLPDNETKESLTIHPPPSLMNAGLQHRASHASRTSSQAPSERGSFRTTHSQPASPKTASPRPSQIQIGAEVQRPTPVHSPVHSYAESQRASHIASLAERIESMKVTPQLIDVRDSGHSRHELDSSPSTPRLHSPRMGSTERYPSTPKEVERYELATARMSR